MRGEARMHHGRILTAIAVVALVGAACGGGGATPGGQTQAASTGAATQAPASVAATQASLGEGEGTLNLIAWAGYVVGGTGGEQVEGYDWVTPFEEDTGCKVTVKVGVDSANMVQLMKT